MKKKKQKKASKKRTNKFEFPEIVRLVHYEISYEPIEHESLKNLPNSVRTQMQELHSLIHKDPDKAIKQLQELIQQYPQVPVLSNYLYIAYEIKGDKKKSNELILKNYQQHPDYLFAKLSYGQYLLDKGKIEEFEKVFNNNFDLQLLYPNRKVFHISEFVLFSSIIGRYFTETNKIKSAKALLNALLDLAPDHHATEVLKNQIMKAELINVLDKFNDRLKNKKL